MLPHEHHFRDAVKLMSSEQFHLVEGNLSDEVLLSQDFEELSIGARDSF